MIVSAETVCKFFFLDTNIYTLIMIFYAGARPARPTNTFVLWPRMKWINELMRLFAVKRLHKHSLKMFEKSCT